jgi:hypothetical protein
MKCLVHRYSLRSCLVCAEGIQLQEANKSGSTASRDTAGSAASAAGARANKRLTSDGDLPVSIVDHSEFGSVVGIACHELDVAIKQPTLFHASFTFEPNSVNASTSSSLAGMFGL